MTVNGQRYSSYSTVDFVWTKGASLVFVVSFGKAKAQHLVSQCALFERSIKEHLRCLNRQ